MSSGNRGNYKENPGRAREWSAPRSAVETRLESVEDLGALSRELGLGEEALGMEGGELSELGRGRWVWAPEH